jgi:site-specific recombinase XerD
MVWQIKIIRQDRYGYYNGKALVKQSGQAYSHAKNTLDAYAADWTHFSGWCDDHKRRALPTSPETILCYVVDLVDRFTVATIDRRLSSIGYYHKQARHGLTTKDPEVERLFRIPRARVMRIIPSREPADGGGENSLVHTPSA